SPSRQSSPSPTGRSRDSWLCSMRLRLLAGGLETRLVSLHRQVALEAVFRHRLREEEALTELAAEVAQRRHLVEPLDAFGDHVELEAPPERDDGRSEALVGLVVGDQERAVHLEDVDRQAAEVAERRVARAEVVHRESDAERLEVVELLDREVHVG